MSWFGSSAPVSTEFELAGLETITDTEKAKEVAASSLKALWELCKSDGWTEVNPGIDDQGLQIRFFDRPDPQNIDQLIKTEAILPFSPKEIFTVVWSDNMQERKKWEPELLTLEVLDHYTEDIGVTYAQMAAPFPVTSRDFCSIRARERKSDSSYLVWGVAVNHKARPINPKFVRAKGQSMWILNPVPGDRYKCHAVKVARVNPMGNIPSWVIGMLKKKSAEQWVKLTDYMRSTVLAKRHPEEEEEEEMRKENLPPAIMPPVAPVEPTAPRHVESAAAYVAAVAAPSRGRRLIEEEEPEELEEMERPAAPARKRRTAEAEYQDSWAYDLTSEESLRHIEQLLLKLEHNVSLLNKRLAEQPPMQVVLAPPAQQQVQQHPPQQQQQAGLRSLGWKLLALLFAWPVAVLFLYHFIRKRMRAIKAH